MTVPIGVVLDATRKLLNDEQRQDLLQWQERMADPGAPYLGLWIYGPRGSGSSYIANVAMRWAMNRHPEWKYEWEQAADLIQSVRDQWTTAEQVRDHPQDYALWEENALIENKLQHFWRKADIVCVDDLHSTHDIKFWRKHLQANLELRVKSRLPTIVATDMPPIYREFADITRVIENLFVICDATR